MATFDQRSQFPNELSGGEQQRVALARALAADVGLILFDEPLSNLDADRCESLRIAIATLARESGATVVYITHDQAEAFALADKVGSLERGSLVQLGTPEEIYRTPASPFVARFTGLAGEFPVEVVARSGATVDVAINGVAGLTVTQIPCPSPGPAASLFIRATAVSLTAATSGAHPHGVIDDVAFTGRGYEHVVNLGSLLHLTKIFAPHRFERGTAVDVVIDGQQCFVMDPEQRERWRMIAAAGASASGLAVLIGAVFLACAVEMVEALTIVLAVGQTRGWKSAMEGTGAAVAALTVLVAIFGPSLIKVPIDALRLIVGGVLLIFGMQWLRKAILRSSGLKAMHDEDAIYAETVAELEAAAGRPDRDRLAFVMAFKGVFLEGLEVVITVITLGTSAHRLGVASVTAAIALLLVGIVGAIVAKQLSAVPENAMKMTVGVMLVAYGTFWAGEGLKVHWPGGSSDVMLLVLVGLYLVVTWGAIAVIKRSARPVEVAA